MALMTCATMAALSARWVAPAVAESGGSGQPPVLHTPGDRQRAACNTASAPLLARAVFLTGAYDVSTFGFAPDGFSDQVSHSPGARFWIPTHNQ